MKVKLTLRMDAKLVWTAKTEAQRRGKSVSQMVGEYFDALVTERQKQPSLPPITASLVGILINRDVAESDYRKHLREKYT